MSNLGLYQKITTYSKKVGGPANFLLLVASGGYGIGKIIEVGIKRTVKTIKNRSKGKTSTKLYYVHSMGKSSEGLTFNVGDSYQVLERDKDAVLIKKIGDTDNPYFVSTDLLHSISDFEGGI